MEERTAYDEWWDDRSAFYTSRAEFKNINPPGVPGGIIKHFGCENYPGFQRFLGQN